MKKNVIIAAIALLAAASCQKNNPSQPSFEGPQGQLIVQLGDEPVTKVADNPTAEKQINSVQLFVFDGSNLETDLYQTGSATSYTLTTGIGDKVVYAIVNAPRLKYTTKATLEQGLSDLSENTANSLVMSGMTTVKVNGYKTGSTTPATCTVNVKRLVSAIQLSNVSVNFAGTTLEGSTFTIKEIYVKNVVGKAPYGVSMALTDAQRSDLDNWYNKLKLDTEPLALTHDTFNEGLSISSNPVDVNNTLYVYPNPSTEEQGTASTFKPRPTRLVIHAAITSSDSFRDESIKNKDYYYTFDLPVLEANKKYKVGVVISMLGKTNDNDDTKTTPGMAAPTISVCNWDNTVELNYQY